MKTDKQIAEMFHIAEWKTAGKDTQYCIVETEDETVILFLGSNSKRDWLTNLTFPKKPYKKMEIPFTVHRGYLKEWKLIRNVFTDYFWKQLETGTALKPITITGHSYGGAIATLCKEQLWHDLPFMRDNIRLVTFGSPRVIGWLNWWKIKHRWDNSTVYRNGSDLVTCVPFILMGFRHVRKNKRIGEMFCLFNIFNVRKYHELNAYIGGLDG